MPPSFVKRMPASSRARRTARALADIIGTGPSAFSAHCTVDRFTPAFSARSVLRQRRIARAALSCLHLSAALSCLTIRA